MDEKIPVENVNVPGHVTQVDAAKYNDMKTALLKVLPGKAPGYTFNDIKTHVKPVLPESTFPGGKALGWWAKTVQLDLEAKGQIEREDSKPLRWHKVS